MSETPDRLIKGNTTTASASTTDMSNSLSINRTITPRNSGLKYQALRSLQEEMAADAVLLDHLPFSMASIRRHNDRDMLTGKKPVLSEKIRIGTIEDESGLESPLWAYLLDNNIINGTTDIAYYSLGRRGKKGIRHSPQDAHEAALRDEFKHCATPSVLTATAKYYFYKKGITSSFPINISKTLARDVVRSCNDYRDTSRRDIVRGLGDVNDEMGTEPGVKMEKDSEPHRPPWNSSMLPSFQNLGPLTPESTISPFLKPAVPSTLGHDIHRKGNQLPDSHLPFAFAHRGHTTTVSRPSETASYPHDSDSSAYHPASGAGSALSSNTSQDSMALLQAIRTQEHQIVNSIHDAQQRLHMSKKEVADMCTKRDQLQTELGKLNASISESEAGMFRVQQELYGYNLAMDEVQTEQAKIISVLDPDSRAMIELGRQLERGPQRKL